MSSLLEKYKPTSEQVVHIPFFMLCFFPFLLSFFLDNTVKGMVVGFSSFEQSVDFPCIFKVATGYNCPVCGMTRCYINMSDLSFHTAWSMNRAGVLLYVFGLIQFLYSSLLIFKAQIPFKKYVVRFQTVFLAIIIILDVYDFTVQFI